MFTLSAFSTLARITKTHTHIRIKEEAKKMILRALQHVLLFLNSNSLVPVDVHHRVFNVTVSNRV